VLANDTVHQSVIFAAPRRSTSNVDTRPVAAETERQCTTYVWQWYLFVVSDNTMLTAAFSEAYLASHPYAHASYILHALMNLSWQHIIMVPRPCRGTLYMLIRRFAHK
jgi:hypothetical protein